MHNYAVCSVGGGEVLESRDPLLEILFGYGGSNVEPTKAPVDTKKNLGRKRSQTVTHGRIFLLTSNFLVREIFGLSSLT